MPQSHRKVRRWWHVLTLFILGGLLGFSLAACGSDDEEGGLSTGDDAPAFSLTDSEGRTVSLADYEGQPVLLFFHMADG